MPDSWWQGQGGGRDCQGTGRGRGYRRGRSCRGTGYRGIGAGGQVTGAGMGGCRHCLGNRLQGEGGISGGGKEPPTHPGVCTLYHISPCHCFPCCSKVNMQFKCYGLVVLCTLKCNGKLVLFWQCFKLVCFVRSQNNFLMQKNIKV